MATTNHHSEHDERVFRTFDSSVKRILGVDMRLVYGLFTPAALVIGLIVILAFDPRTWLLVAIVAVEIGALALVLIGLREMLRTDAGEPPA